jgi:hypothetical protein
MTNVPAATSTVPVLDQVLSTVVTTTQQQPMQTTIQTPPPSPPPTTASGGAGSLLLSGGTQTIGGEEGAFGGASINEGDKPGVDKLGGPRGSDRKDEETGPKKNADKPVTKKFAICS